MKKPCSLTHTLFTKYLESVIKTLKKSMNGAMLSLLLQAAIWQEKNCKKGN